MMFSRVPEYFFKDMLDILDYVARFKTKYLAGMFFFHFFSKSDYEAVN
jgi:hypothetical protein